MREPRPATAEDTAAKAVVHPELLGMRVYPIGVSGQRADGVWLVLNAIGGIERRVAIPADDVPTLIHDLATALATTMPMI